uniref:Uncharacterized protein n=1 Tax=Megaselia scalaris TaxID=36166 RepID=T1GCU4_MEGSC
MYLLLLEKEAPNDRQSSGETDQIPSSLDIIGGKTVPSVPFKLLHSSPSQPQIEKPRMKFH